MKDKVVLITGGSRGIGKATAKQFVKEGAKVVIVARKRETLEATINELKSVGGIVIGENADVRDIKQIEKVVSEVIGELGRIDILINDAAVVHWKNFLELKKDDWVSEVDINIKGVLNCTYTVAPYMVKQLDGIIINIASGAGKTGYPQLAVYSATKFAVLGFTQGFAQEVADKGVRVYAVCPGMTATRMTNYSGMPPEKVAKRILETAKETLGLRPGEDTEIYS